MVKTVNALGDACPLPVVKAKNAIKELSGGGTVEVLVDNEIAVQNLTKMANQKGYGVRSEKKSEDEYHVTLEVPAGAADAAGAAAGTGKDNGTAAGIGKDNGAAGLASEAENCVPDRRRGIVVAVTSQFMGTGDDKLGAALMKAFLFTLTQQDELPRTILFYNGGAFLTTEGSVSLEDLRSLEAQGVEILTCGTCLNFYGLTEKLQVGGVTNMYDIVERLTNASLVVRP